MNKKEKWKEKSKIPGKALQAVPEIKLSYDGEELKCCRTKFEKETPEVF